MNRELFLALESGDVANIQRLHGQNSRVLFDVTFQEDTPLHIAAREGHLTVVEWILRVKPSLAGARNKDSNMPLHEAAKCGNRELVRILLESKKSSAYYCNMFGETALIIASRYGHVETVRLLVETRSYNDLVEMRRSFRVAAYGRYPDVAKAILQNPIEPQRFRRLLLLLIEWDTYQYVAKTILHNLIKAYKISNLSKHMVHNLYQAVHGGHLEIVEAVLNSPAWKDNLMTRPDINGMCAIHVAAMKGHWGIINEFRSRWPDSVEIRNSDHKTVLHFAVQYNQMEIVKNLLADKSPQKVAELVSRDHDDYFHDTALHLAAKNGVDPELVRYLVSFQGANVNALDINALNDEDKTALDIASAAAPHNPNCDSIKQILENAGGIRWSFIPNSNITSDPSNEPEQGEDKDIVDTHMVVASLIATVTFAAIFQIPGGIDDNINSEHYEAAKMAFRRLFRFFIFSDTAAFTSSLTVVVAWVVKQLLGDTYSGRQTALSRLSGITLIVSILWTIAAFVSASVIVIVPPHHEKLKSKDKKAFAKFQSLWQLELALGFLVPFGIGSMLVLSNIRFLSARLSFKVFLCYIYIELFLIMSIIIDSTFQLT